MNRYTAFARKAGRPYMMAVVLGTALSTLGPAVGMARADAPDERALADLSRYCTACWRNARLPVDSWNDCTQEVLCRLLQTVPRQDWPRVLASEGYERREFVRAIDAVKKRTQRSRKLSSQGLESVADDRPGRDRDLDEQRKAVVQAADEVLTPRQQRIVQLSLNGWSVQEIADELKVGPERVSDEKYKAVRKLRSHLVGQEA